MNFYLYLLFIILVLFNKLFDLLYISWFWQIKEYRWDRIKSSLYLEKEIEKILPVITFPIFRILLLLILGFLISSFLFVFVLLTYLIESIYKIFFSEQKGVFRPRITFKIFILLFSSILLFGTFIIFFFNISIVNIIYLDLLILVLIPILASFLSLPTYLGKKYLINKAHDKIRSLKNLQVIGITGSYGKTSTKEFLYTLLSSKYRVLKTPKNVNTEIGIAKHILKFLKPEHEFYIVEMGAYRVGEIATIAKMIRHRYAILTGITNQHLSLFGSLSNIIKTKFEIIDYLDENGVGVLNIDNEYIEQRFKDLSRKKNLISVGIKNKNAQFRATNIVVKDTFLQFSVLNKNNVVVKDIQIPIIGEHNIINILLAVVLAWTVGMTWQELEKALTKIRAIPQTMTYFRGIKNCLVIDDSYNTNPSAIQAALKYLQQISYKQKIFFLSKIIELGRKSQEIHIELLTKLRENINILLISDTDYKFFQKLFKKINLSDVEIFVIKKGKIPPKLKNLIDENTVIMCEGRSSHLFIKNLKKLN